MSNSNNSSATSGGIGFLGLLFIVLLVLKLTVREDLSWWWVSAPIWGPVGLLIVGGSIYFLAVVIYHSIKNRRDRRILESVMSIAAVKDISLREAAEVYAKDNPKHAKWARTLAVMAELKNGKSRWQQKIEEMQESQRQRLRRTN